MLIAAYNEEKIIEAKLQNTLELNYPLDCLEIIVASDGSSDKTSSIVECLSKQHPQIKLIEFKRMGKSNVINAAIESVSTDIIVFSDANTMYDSNALKELVSRLAPQDVGCVCGRLIYHNPKDIISGTGESIYWKYETQLKIMESHLGYVAGANGAIYAIKKQLFEKMPLGTINDDFMISMKIVQNGYKSLYAPEAKAYEEVAPSVGGEFKRHIRDGAGHYIALLHLLKLFNPFIGIRSFIFWSHRILRWCAPVFLIILFLLNLYLANTYAFYKILLVPHATFYLLAVIGLLIRHRKKIPFLIYVPFYFCNLNLALFLGLLKALTKQQKTIWSSTQR
ncbi:MAG: glycosyltransferase family 2 protein [Bacteriovoracaceae bacterium]|nr:glycosyltransferase family 2 protein [Bacteriovoracaceae bacterium]